MKLRATSFILAAFLMITGCNSKENVNPVTQPEKKADSAKESNPIEEKEQQHFSNTYPLTGIGTNEEPEGRAVAVMVNNHPKARPQSGLSKADIVYEMLAESEVTRFLAVFQSEKPEYIGPVRSARKYYIELAKGMNALYIAHGYSPEAKALLNQGYVDSLNGIAYDGTLFKRVKFRKAPHNSYISFDNIEKGAAKKSYDLNTQPRGFTFLTEQQIENLQGNSAPAVNISYGTKIFNVQFEYDGSLGKYKRFSGGEQTVEYGVASPVLIDNIFIIEASHRIVDNNGRRDINLKKGGKGYLLQKGKMNEVEWVNKDGRIIPVKNGVEIGFVPGKTWVNIVPDRPGLQHSVSFDSKPD